MRDYVLPIAVILLVLASTFIVTWSIGAFTTWNVGWAFVDYETRVDFLSTSVLVGLVLGVLVFPLLGG